MRIPQRAAIYCRLSYAPDGSLEKVERQEEDCRSLADRLAWPISDEHIYRDNSRSAWQRNRRRPRWDAMLEALDRNEIDGVLVYHGDRLIRQPWDLELLLKLADDRHISLASVSGTRDLSNEDDRYILRIEAAGACRSSADTSRRVRRGWAARAQRGQSIGGGKRPFGFGAPTDRVGTTGKPIFDTTQTRRDEAAVIAEAAERLQAGQSQGGVVAWMNTVSTTTEGQRWTAKSARNVLLSPRTAGLVQHEGILYEAVWDPIISQEQQEDLRLIFAKNAKENPYPGKERKYLLSGLAICDGCKHPVRAKPTGGRNAPDSRIYFCQNRDCQRRVGRNVALLDRYVTGRVLRRLQDPKVLSLILTAPPAVAAEIAALERRKQEALETLRTLVDHPGVSAAVIAQSLEGFDTRIAELRSRHATSQRQRLLARMAGITPEQWTATPIDMRTATVRALYQVIIMQSSQRGPGFDVNAVKLIPIREDNEVD